MDAHTTRLFRGFNMSSKDPENYQDFSAPIKQYWTSSNYNSHDRARSGWLGPDLALAVERIFQQDGLFPAGSDGNQNNFSIQKLLDALNIVLRG